MGSLSASFVPILAVMSGEAEQMERHNASVEQMEASLTALIAGQQFALLQSGVGRKPPGTDKNPERDEEEKLD